MVCPVCREPICYDLAALRAAPPPELSALAAGFRATDELRSLQRRMAALFRQQQQRGGLIDLEQEKNKYLLVTAPGTEQVGGAGVCGMASGGARCVEGES